MQNSGSEGTMCYMSWRASSVGTILMLAACGGGSAETPPDAAIDAEILAPELGTGDHTPGSVTLTEIADDVDNLTGPRDLAFNPLRPEELWVVNYTLDSVVIVHDAPVATRSSELRIDAHALHFMAEVSAIDFGQDETTFGLPGTFATCGESRNTYNDTQPPNDFMGPALWSSDLSIFARVDPNGLGSHLDMLHCSPLCMGIAHEEANVYWTFSGLSGAITKYDFMTDNGIGNDDHSDGTAFQYVTGEVAYQPGVPSHLTYDADDGMLYIADTGNARIAQLDTTSGTVGAPLPALEPMIAFNLVEGATLTDVVPASSGLVERPSGIELRSGFLYVTDNANGRISAFDLAGQRVNWLDTGLAAGSLAGLTFGPDGRIYFVDMLGDRVLRVDP